MHEICTGVHLGWIGILKMNSLIASRSFQYVLTLDEFRNSIPVDCQPSWVKITTIGLVSTQDHQIDLQKLTRAMNERNAIRIKIKDSTSQGFEWKIKPPKNVEMYNQVSFMYEDEYGKKAVKVFKNSSIQVAGCSDLFDCVRIATQIITLLNELIGDVRIPVDSYRIVLINTNFSLNYNVNLIRIVEHFGKSDMFDVSFKPDEYSAVKIKFRPLPGMKQVTVSIFSTGKIIITGAETLMEIAYAYNIITTNINSNVKMKVSKTIETDVFNCFMGYKFTDLVPYLKKQGYKPWTTLNSPTNING